MQNPNTSFPPALAAAVTAVLVLCTVALWGIGEHPDAMLLRALAIAPAVVGALVSLAYTWYRATPDFPRLTPQEHDARARRRRRSRWMWIWKAIVVTPWRIHR